MANSRAALVVLRCPAVKVRIDKLLVERGLAPSRERAQALLLAGKVMAGGQKVEKAGAQVDAAAEIRLLGEDLKYVGRGGLKLENALQHWKIDVVGRTCLDIGASTGGFTDCLLQHGAGRVVAVDTGYGQMDARLREDARVRLMERTNARYLKKGDLKAALEGVPPITFVAMDVSFISATLVVPPVLAAVRCGGASPLEMVVLVKPQFEVGRKQVGKGGIVRDESAQQGALDKVRRAVRDLEPTATDTVDSPILGAEGNREFLLYARF